MKAVLDPKFHGFDQEEIARYFDKDGNPTIEHPDSLHEATDEQLSTLMHDPEVLYITKLLISQIKEKRFNERVAEERFNLLIPVVPTSQARTPHKRVRSSL